MSTLPKREATCSGVCSSYVPHNPINTKSQIDTLFASTHMTSEAHIYPGASVYLGPIPQQYPNNVSLVGPGREMQRSLASDRGYIGAGLVLQQVYDDIHAAHEAGDVQRRQARLRSNTQ